MNGPDPRIDPNREILLRIADALGEMRDEVVFVGGCATGLLITEPRAAVVRATRDVDVIVRAHTLLDYQAAERTLGARGFRPDRSPDAPVCRWQWQGITLDLMPSDTDVLGFHNRWYPLAYETALS